MHCGSGSSSSSGFFLLIRLEKNFIEKLLHYYNFNPIWVQHASIYVKMDTVLKSKKVIVKVFYKKFNRSRGWSQSRSWSRNCNSDLRLHLAEAKRNIFGSPRLISSLSAQKKIRKRIPFPPWYWAAAWSGSRLVLTRRNCSSFRPLTGSRSLL